MTRLRFHPLRVADVRAVAADAVTLGFAVPAALRDAYRFRPGQYLTLRATIAGQDVRRSYSICSGLDDDTLRVGIKRVEGGVFSTWACSELRAGETIAVMTPDGRFGLPPADGGRVVVAFAAGSGITPVLSVMRTLLAREPDSRFFLFYGNRLIESIMFRSEIEDLKDRYLTRLSVFHILSREQQDVPALNGRLDADTVRRLLRSLLPVGLVDQVLVCGPQPMIEGAAAVLLDLGLPQDRVHVERYTPAVTGAARVARVVAVADPAGVVEAISDGVRSVFPVAAGEAIIDASIRAGRALPYSCRGGMCCTCRAKVLEGRVEMAVNYSLEAWETQAGYVLTCQARVVTARVVVDYDQV
jgi:ring-1,2-phenylacetyl-CoA epoxidase subunit PaaE